MRTLIFVAALAAAPGALAAEDEAKGDIGITIEAMSDYMDTGYTNSDHNPSVLVSIDPSIGIFYSKLSTRTIDYGVTDPTLPDPKLETKFAIGATPEFDKLSVDFNLEYRIKWDDPAAERLLPYVTGTYTFNDSFSASLAAGYYEYLQKGEVDFWELYSTVTYTHPSGASFFGEFTWEPDSDGAGNYYYDLIGTLTVPFHEKFEAYGKLGYEGYEDKASTPPYLWWELGLNYAFNDHIKFGVAYHGNDLSNSIVNPNDPLNEQYTKCSLQAYTDCADAVFAKLTLSGNLSDLKK
jgi:opacity protein-like surface antigen